MRGSKKELGNQCVLKSVVRFALLLFLFSGTCIEVLAQYPGSKRVPREWKPGFQSIRLDDAKDILGFLASVNTNGRKPGQVGGNGYEIAAGFAAGLFRQWGLKPAGDNGSYFQYFNMIETSVSPESAGISSEDGSFKLEPGRDFSFRAYSDVDLKVQFAFIRMTKDADLSKLDLSGVKGKILIFNSDSFGNNLDGALKLSSIAIANGALAITTARSASQQLAFAKSNSVEGIPVFGAQAISTFIITSSAAQKLAQRLRASNFLAGMPNGTTIETGAESFDIRAKVDKKLMFTTMNVVAKIEGSDPALKEEAVILGAHLDHMGVVGKSTYFGADDNGSGSTAALLAARAIMLNPIKPKLTIIVGLWSLEELGLWGSWAYANRPAVPLDHTVAYLNMDMVGRNEDRGAEKAVDNVQAIRIKGARSSRELEKLMLNVNSYVNFQLKYATIQSDESSDTGSFMKMKVATAGLFSGQHPDYHHPTDTIEKINFDKLVNASKLVYLAAEALATGNFKPSFTPYSSTAPATGIAITGSISYLQKIALTDKSVAEIKLIDVTLKNAPELLVSRQFISPAGQIPIKFTLPYNPAQIDPTHKYEVRARILEAGKPVFVSKIIYPALSNGSASTFDLRLEMVRPR